MAVDQEKGSEVQLETASDGSGGKLEQINTTSDPADDFKFTFGKFLAIVSFQLGYLSDIISGAGVSAIVNTINADIGPDASYDWIIVASLVATSTTAPVVGQLGDLFGRRNVLILGNILGMLGNLVSAVGQNVNTLIGGSVLIGLGSGMHQIGWAAVGEIVPRKTRPLAIGLFEASVSPGGATGALIAFAMVKNSTWRNFFWLNFALNGASLILCILFYHPVNQYIVEEGKTRWQQIQRFDFLGIFLFAAGLVLFLLGLSFGGTTYPWKSAGTLAPLLIGILLLAACGIWENNTKNPYAIFPHKVMRNWRGFTIVTGCTFLVGVLYYSSLILFPLEVQVLFTQDPITIGLYSMALPLGGMIGGLTCGFTMHRTNKAKWILVFFCGWLTVTSGVSAIVRPGTHIASTLIVALIGVGLSGATVASNAMIQLTVPHQYVGIAMGIVTTARNVGGSVATTIYTTILKNELAKKLGVGIATALAKAGLPLAEVPGVTEAIATGNTTSSAFIGVSPAILEAGAYGLKIAYCDSFKVVYLVSIAFGVVGTICGMGTMNVGKFMTHKVDVRLDEGAHIQTKGDTGGHIIDHDGEEVSKTAGY